MALLQMLLLATCLHKRDRQWGRAAGGWVGWGGGGGGRGGGGITFCPLFSESQHTTVKGKGCENAEHFVGALL